MIERWLGRGIIWVLSLVLFFICFFCSHCNQGTLVAYVKGWKEGLLHWICRWFDAQPQSLKACHMMYRFQRVRKWFLFFTVLLMRVVLLATSCYICAAAQHVMYSVTGLELRGFVWVWLRRRLLFLEKADASNCQPGANLIKFLCMKNKNSNMKRKGSLWLVAVLEEGGRERERPVVSLDFESFLSIYF